MLNIKNAFLLIVGTVFLLIGISVTNFRQNMVVVVADKNDFTDADYTDSDYLYNQMVENRTRQLVLLRQRLMRQRTERNSMN